MPLPPLPPNHRVRGNAEEFRERHLSETKFPAPGSDPFSDFLRLRVGIVTQEPDDAGEMLDDRFPPIVLPVSIHSLLNADAFCRVFLHETKLHTPLQEMLPKSLRHLYVELEFE